MIMLAMWMVQLEGVGKNFERLAYLELLKAKPFGAVYDFYCVQNGVPASEKYIGKVEEYESDILAKRSTPIVAD